MNERNPGIGTECSSTGSLVEKLQPQNVSIVINRPVKIADLQMNCAGVSVVGKSESRGRYAVL